MTSYRLYRLGEDDDYWFADVEGDAVRTRWGKSGALWRELHKGKANDKSKSYGSPENALKILEGQAAAKREEGFLPVGELDAAKFLREWTTSITTYVVEDEADLGDKYQWNYTGGVPKGVTAKNWPKIDGEHALHFACVDTGGSKDSRGICAFITPSGGTFALMMSEPHLKRKPKSDAPVPVAEPMALECEDTDSREIALLFATPLIEADPDFGRRLRELFDAAGYEPVTTKEGGAPVGLAEEKIPTMDGEAWKLVAQFDLNDLDVSNFEAAWPDVELTGIIYIFRSPSGTEGSVIWER